MQKPRIPAGNEDQQTASPPNPSRKRGPTKCKPPKYQRETRANKCKTPKYQRETRTCKVQAPEYQWVTSDVQTASPRIPTGDQRRAKCEPPNTSREKRCAEVHPYFPMGRSDVQKCILTSQRGEAMCKWDFLKTNWKVKRIGRKSGDYRPAAGSLQTGDSYSKYRN